MAKSVRPTKAKVAKVEPKQFDAEALALALSKKIIFRPFSIWLVGATPLICHAWSQKAKLAMLGSQAKATKGGKEPRNPEQDFVDSLYDMGDGRYGFPVTGLKNCFLSSAHKDRGIPKTEIRGALWLNHEIVSVRPALAGAHCNMPLVEVTAPPPLMREDMVRVGAGLNKKANLAYRAEFWPWAIKVTGRYNEAMCSGSVISFLVDSGGIATGIGDWRNEKNGIFGAFRQATEEEVKAWTRFRDGKGPVPKGATLFDDQAEAA
jgi:hypothetical protein